MKIQISTGILLLLSVLCFEQTAYSQPTQAVPTATAITNPVTPTSSVSPSPAVTATPRSSPSASPSVAATATFTPNSSPSATPPSTPTQLRCERRGNAAVCSSTGAGTLCSSPNDCAGLRCTFNVGNGGKRYYTCVYGGEGAICKVDTDCPKLPPTKYCLVQKGVPYCDKTGVGKPCEADSECSERVCTWDSNGIGSCVPLDPNHPGTVSCKDDTECVPEKHLMCRQGMCAKWSPNFSDWEGSCTQEGQTSECETKHTCQRVTTPTGGLSIECRDGIYPGSPTGCDPQATNPCTIPDKTCNFDFSDGPVCQEGVWSGISCTADDDPATPDDPCRGLSHTECYLDDDGVKSCHWVAGAGSNMCTGIDGNVDPSFCANVPIPTQVSTQQSAPLSSSASTEKSAAQSPNISAQESAARYRLALDKMEDEESEDLENANDRIDMREFDQITTTNGFGDTNAPVTMYVIQDLKCGVGKGFFAKVIKPLKEEFVSQGVLQIRFIEYPLVRGGDDEGLAKAAICSGQQGSYPQFISYLYHNMGKTSAEESGQYARMLGLNEEKFLKCIESEDTEQILKSHLELVKRLGVTGTPQTVINGKLFPGGQPIEVIRAHIQKLLARKSVS